MILHTVDDDYQPGCHSPQLLEAFPYQETIPFHILLEYAHLMSQRCAVLLLHREDGHFR